MHFEMELYGMTVAFKIYIIVCDSLSFILGKLWTAGRLKYNEIKTVKIHAFFFQLSLSSSLFLSVNLQLYLTPESCEKYEKLHIPGPKYV